MGTQSADNNELNPLESCINALHTDIKTYIKDNESRETRKEATCFSWRLAGHDSALAAKKMQLAKNIDYTLGQIHQDYKSTITRIAGYTDIDKAQLAYIAFCSAFARIQDCIQAGLVSEKTANTTLARAGLLAQALHRAEKTWRLSWDQAKDNIWEAKALHGQLFEYNPDNKAAAFRKFDLNMNSNLGSFTAIMVKPEVDVVLDNAIGVDAPDQTPPPAYNQEAAPAVDPFVTTVIVGTKKVQFSDV